MKSKILYLLLTLLLAFPIYAEHDSCEEYRHIALGIITLHHISSIVFDLSNNYTIEPPYVDSVWIVNTEQEPLRKLEAQSGDTIDVSFLEKQGTYILRVYINGCMKSTRFVHRVTSTDLENNTTSPLQKRKFFCYKGVLCYEAPDGKRYDILGRKL